MDLYVNELSIATPVANHYAARQLMDSFIETIRTSAALGLDVMRTDVGFWGIPLAAGYSILSWANDTEVERERRLYLKTVGSKGPFVGEMVTKLEDERLIVVEGRCNGTPSRSLVAAALLDHPVASFARDPWRLETLEIDCVSLDAEGAETEEIRHVVNLFDSDSVTRRREWIAEQTKNEIVSGEDLLRRAATLLPGVEFGDLAFAQVADLGKHHPQFKFVLDHLFELNRRVGTWEAGEFAEGYGWQCSPESDATMQKFGGDRIFPSPDGPRQFSWHSKINFGKWRIYLIAERHPRKRVVVGYVGRHLRTVENP